LTKKVPGPSRQETQGLNREIGFAKDIYRWKQSYVGKLLPEGDFPVIQRKFLLIVAGLSLVIPLRLAVAWQAPGDPPASGPAGDLSRTASSYWVLSTREIATDDIQAGVTTRLQCYRADQGGCLSKNDPSALAEEIRQIPRLVVYLPGNRSDLSVAHSQGWQLYRDLRRNSPGAFLVFVVWSWPSDRVTLGQRSDIWIKACRADHEAYILAEWITGLPAETHMTLVSYSLSARVVAGASHLLAGGELAGRTVSPPAREKLPVLKSLWAGAAIDAHSLGPGQQFGRALEPLRELVLTVHPRDRLLRLYPLLYGLRGPEALGVVGPTALADEMARKVEILPLSQWAAPSHAWEIYFRALPVQARLEQMVWESSPSPVDN
jgi:hypothetical protein